MKKFGAEIINSANPPVHLKVKANGFRWLQIIRVILILEMLLSNISGIASAKNVLISSRDMQQPPINALQEITNQTPNATQSSIQVTSPHRADGGDSAEITVTVKDGTGASVQGVQVVLKVAGDGVQLTQPANLTDGNGITTASLTSTVPGPKTVDAYFVTTTGSTKIAQSAEVVFTGSTISGTVFDDLDQDGSLDNGEAGVAGILVQLSTESGQLVASTHSNANGIYQLEGINSGTYTISVQPVFDYGPAEGLSKTVTISAFSENSGNDFGLFEAANITGTVWKDDNQDARIGKDESRLSGVTISASPSEGSPITTSSNSYGNYKLLVPSKHPAGPINFTFNQTGYAVNEPLSALITNSNFESLGYALDSSTYPANYNFELGNLGSWESSAFSVVSGSYDGSYAAYRPTGTTGGLTSPAFTIPAGAQSLTWHWKNNYSDGTYFYLLDAVNGQTLATMYSGVGTNGYWLKYSYNIAPFIGKTVKFQLLNGSSGHYLYLDDVQLEVNVPGWEISDNMNKAQAVQVVSGSYDDSYAANLPSGTTGKLTSPAFTIPAEAQSLTWHWKNNYSDGTYFYLLDAANGQTLATMCSSSNSDNSVGTNGYWLKYSYNIAPFIGKTVKFQVVNARSGHYLYLDDVQLEVNVPGWEISGSMTNDQAVQVVSGSYDGSYAAHRPTKTAGGLTSPAFTIPAGAQSLTWHWKNNFAGGTSFYLLDVANGQTLTMYSGVGTRGYWHNLSYNIAPFIGKTVKFQVVNGSASDFLDLDDVMITPNPTNTYTTSETNPGGYASSTLDSFPLNLYGGQTVVINYGDYTVDTGRSTVEVDNNSVSAGTGEVTVTATLRDASGNAMSGQQVQIESSGSQVVIDQTNTTTNTLGKVTAILHSNLAQTLTVFARLSPGVILPSTQTVTFTAGPVSASKSTITVSPTLVTANNTTASMVTVTLKDEYDNPVSEHQVALTHNGTHITVDPAQATTDQQGQVTASVRSDTAQQVTLQAQDVTDENAVLTLEPSAPLQFVATDPDQSTIAISAPAPLTADGIVEAQITVTLKDRNGTALEDRPVTLQIVTGTDNRIEGIDVGETLVSLGNTNASGMVTARLTSTRAETKTFQVYGEGIALSQAGSVTFLPGSPSDVPSITFTPTNPVADGQPVAATLTLKDSQGNAIPNHNIKISSDLDVTLNLPEPVTTDPQGEYLFTLSSTLVGTATLFVVDQTVGLTLDQLGSVTFRVGPADPDHSTVEVPVKSAQADGSGQVTVNVAIKDHLDHPIPGQEVHLDVSGSANTVNGPLPAQTGADGTTTFTLTSTHAENKTLTVLDTTQDVTLSQKPQVSFYSGSISLAKSSIEIDPTKVAADGTSSATITVYVRDANQNPISGVSVNLTKDSTNAALTQSEETTDSSGMYTGWITDDHTEVVHVSAYLGQNPTPLTVPVTFDKYNLQIGLGASAQTKDGMSSRYATAGNTIKYTVIVKNQGAMASPEDVLIDKLPAGFVYQSGPTNCTINGPVVSCPIASIAVGDQAAIEFVAAIDSSVRGNATNAVMLESDANNSKTITTFVEAPTAALRFDPQSVVLETSPGPEGTASATFHLYNDGLAGSGPLTLSLTNPLADGDWVQLSPSTVNSLPGNSNTPTTITVNINTPSGQAYGQYLGALLVKDGQNNQVLSLPLTVKVVHPRKTVTFTVMDNVSSDAISGAVLTLTRLNQAGTNDSYTRVTWSGGTNVSTSTYTPALSRVTDQDGKIVFDVADLGLEAGKYQCTLSANYYETITDTIDITDNTSKTWALTAKSGLYLETYQAIMGVKAGDQVNQTLTVTNPGAATLTGLKIELVDTNVNGTMVPAPAWVSLMVPSPVPDLASHMPITFTLAAQPEQGVTEKSYPVTLRVSALGQSPQSAQVNVIISSNQTRNVKFLAVDEEQLDPSSNPMPVTTGGRVILTKNERTSVILDNQTVQYQKQYSQTLSEAGEAVFNNLEVGKTYDYQLWADNYSYAEGSFTVQAPTDGGTDQQQQVPLQADHFIYTWKVIEGTADLSYKLILTINNPDGSSVTSKPKWCNDEDGCHWSSDGATFGTGADGSGNGGSWYSLPRILPRPAFRLARLQLSQTMLLEWQSFTGSLWLQNTADTSLDNMTITILAATETGDPALSENDATSKFKIQAAGQPDGVAVLHVDHPIAPGGKLDQSWQILPKGGLTQATKYRLYARIEYDINGEHQSFLTIPEWITVNPSPSLDIEYDVPVPEEPCLEFDILAKITNAGAGDAKNLRFNTNQVIITPLDGLGAMTAQIIKTTVNGVEQASVLTANVGDLPGAGGYAEVIWTIRVSEPVEVLNVTGLLYQDDPTQRGIAAVSSFTVKLKPGSCKFIPVPKDSTRDAGGKKDGECLGTSYNDSQEQLGDPINVRTGSVDYLNEDLSLNTLAGPLQFKRWYSTQAINIVQSPLGPGWTHNFDSRLTLPTRNPGVVKVKTTSTNEYKFWAVDGEYTPFQGLFATLKKQGEDYLLEDCTHQIFTFDAAGKLLSKIDAQGHGFIYEYYQSGESVGGTPQPEGFLKIVHDNNPLPGKQHWIQLSYYDTRQLQKVSEDTGRLVTFVYDANGDLQYVHDALEQIWDYTYDGTSHRLASVGVEVPTASGSQVRIIERTEYDPQGRAISQYNGNDEKVVSLDYSVPKQTTVTDALGQTTIYKFDGAGTLINKTVGSGSPTLKSYFPSNFREANITDAMGNVSGQTWSEDGARLTSMVDPTGGTTSLMYDPSKKNSLQRYTDALGHTTQYGYNDQGTLLQSTTNAQGNKTEYQYTDGTDGQPQGLLSKVIDSSEHETEYHYSDTGQKIWQRENYLKNGVWVNGLMTSYTYDAAGRLRTTTAPDGQVQSICYDNAGRVVRTVSSPTAITAECDQNYVPGPGAQAQDKIYDAVGNLIAVVDLLPGCQVVQQTDGRLTATDACQVTRTYYDGADRPISIVKNWHGADILNDTPPEAELNANNRIDTVYNATGNRIATIQVMPGCSVTRSKDADSHPVVTTTAECVVDRTYYDSNHRPEYEVKNWVMPGQAVTDDQVPGVDRRTNNENITTQTIYDLNGNAIATISLLPGCVVTPEQSEGEATLSISDSCIATRTYLDANNRPISTVQNWRDSNLLKNTPPDPSGTPEEIDQNIRTDRVYDLQGNQIASVQVLPGCAINRDKDANGAPYVTVTAGCRVTRTYYDSLNRSLYVVNNWNVWRGDSLVVTDETTQEDILTGNVRSTTQNLTSRTVYDSLGRTLAMVSMLPGCTLTQGTNAQGKTIYTASSACMVNRTYYDEQGRYKESVQNVVGQSIDEDLIDPIPYDPQDPAKADQNVPSAKPIYNADGENIANVDPLGRVNRTFSDAMHRPVKTTQNLRDPLHPEATLQELLDAAQPFPYNNNTDWADRNITTETRYDEQGRAIAVIDPLGRVTRTYYDSAGRAFKTVVNLRDPDNLEATVDELLAKFTGEDAASMPPRYSDLIPEHADWNVTTELIFDAAGRTIATVMAPKTGCSVSRETDGSVSASDACVVTRTYFDRLGRAYAVVRNFKGQDITDPGLPPAVDRTNEANLITFTVYDAKGQTIAAIEPNPNCSVDYSQNPDTGLTSVSIGSACIVQRTYFDDLGRTKSAVKNWQGTDLWSEEPPNRPVRPTPPAHYTNPDVNVRVDSDYDAAGRLLETTDPEGIITHYVYNELGQLEKVIENYQVPWAPTEQVNVTTVYSYTAQGKRASIRSANDVQVEQDLKKIDPNASYTPKLTTFSYDALGRLKSERDPLGKGMDYAYNVLSQQSSQKGYYGKNAQGEDIFGPETGYEYDELNRVEKIDYPGSDIDVTFTYLPTGQRQTMADSFQSSGVTTWEYDALGRTLSVVDPFNQKVEYRYNGLGQRTRLVYPNLKQVQYDYNGLGQLTHVTDWNALITRYEYYPNGLLHITHLPNGVDSTYIYSAVGWVNDIIHQHGQTELASYHYDYGPSGNRLEATENISQVDTTGMPPAAPEALTAEQRGVMAIALNWQDKAVNESGYKIERSTDGQHWQLQAELGPDTSRYVDTGLLRYTDYWYRLTGWNNQGQANPIELHTSTGFDPVTFNTPGGKITLSIGAVVSQTIRYGYDALYRLTTADYNDGSFFHYEYDANGNRLAEVTQNGRAESTYDAANRLTQVGTMPAYSWDDNGNLLHDGTNIYTYDAANRLASVSQGNSTITFGYNGLGDRLTENSTHFVLDLNAGLTQVLQDGTNEYLYGNGRIAQYSGSDSAYFLGDSLGSVRQMTDSDGVIKLTRSYEPYGKVLSSYGSGNSKYGFSGERQDPSGYVYLRSRIYDPITGRFTQKDPSRQEQNLYRYSNDDPVNRIDPNGLFSKEVIAANMGFMSFDQMIASIAQYNREKPIDTARKWGFYALLLDAQDNDSFQAGTAVIKDENSLGGFVLRGFSPSIIRSVPEKIWLQGCVIMIGPNMLRDYMNNESSAVRRRLDTIYWWRDTSPDFYSLQNSGTTTWYADRIPVTDGEGWRLPDYYSFDGSVGEGVGVNMSIIIDRFGNEYYSIGGWAGISISLPVTLGTSEGFANSENNFAIVAESKLKNEYITDVSTSSGGSIGEGSYLFKSIKGPQESLVFSLSPSVNLNGAIMDTFYLWTDPRFSWEWMLSTQMALGNGPDDLINGTYKKLPYPLP